MIDCRYNQLTSINIVLFSLGLCKLMEKVTGDVDRSNELVGSCSTHENSYLLLDIV